MRKLSKLARQLTIVAGISLMTFSNSGCHMAWGFTKVLYEYCLFWETTPIIPVSAWQSQRIEDVYHDEERYGKVPVLDPVEGENAPLFCMDPPSKDEVMRALPDDTAGGLPFVAETHRNNVRIVIEPMVDRLGECKFFPMIGPARVHYCHYKCTVYYDKVIRSNWPIPFTHEDKTQEVVYIDKNHLIRCAGMATPTTP